jgi:hypothetical protein
VQLAFEKANFETRISLSFTFFHFSPSWLVLLSHTDTHFIGSRVETRRFQSMRQLVQPVNLYSPAFAVCPPSSFETVVMPSVVVTSHTSIAPAVV